MKILSYDCFSGISGDMNLGAMIDLGVDQSFLRDELKKLGVDGWELKVEKDQRHGIKGTRATVVQTRHEHVHRHLQDIEKIIRSSSLEESTKALSMNIFMKIAVAEARVHGTTVDKVHFHEVGAIDSIVDVVGAAICFNALDVEGVHLSSVELGGGYVNCDHGKLPVPAPATAEIVQGMPVRKGGADFETTTPTGAAILAALVTDYSPSLKFRIDKTAYGIGQKDNPSMPNILRVFLGETIAEADSGHDAMLLECNIDDMNPEFYNHISGLLFASGASDVYMSGIQMKKFRPGILLSVICENETAEKMKHIIFTETTTLGLRTFTFKKETLSRRFDTVTTKWGDVGIKTSTYKGKTVSVKPEYDDCSRIAAYNGIALKEVYNEALRIAETMLDT